MFQNALHLRLVLLTGRTPLCECGLGSEKPWIPWCSGDFPVAMVDQSMGEIIGRILAKFPITPCSIRLCKAGISPRSISGLMICQSAPSQPIRSSFLVRRFPDIESFIKKRQRDYGGNRKSQLPSRVVSRCSFQFQLTVLCRPVTEGKMPRKKPDLATRLFVFNQLFAATVPAGTCQLVLIAG
jgi:hypothetical protein